MPSSTTTATDGSISSSQTTSISIWPRHRCPHQDCADTKGWPWHAGRPGYPAARTCCTTTAATAPSTTFLTRPASLAQTGRTDWEWRRSTSTATVGLMCTWRTTRIRARCIATTGMARSQTSPRAPAAPTVRTERRSPAWGSRSATTIATARWTFSRRTSRATHQRCTRIPAAGRVRIGRSLAASGSTPDGSAGASAFSISTTMAGSICSW